MALHRHFLLYTTTHHELVALRLSASGAASSGASGDAAATPTTLSRLRRVVAERGAESTERRLVGAGLALTRGVERGARLVVCCATETAVVLQVSGERLCC